MLRALSLGTTLLAFVSASVAWAQSGADDPAFPFSKWTIRWDYSCPSGTSCSFVCPAAGETGLTSHVLKLRLFLGTISADGGQAVPALFYEFNTREYPHGSGFSIGSGLTTLSCQVNGMTLDYSGGPKAK
jgi:hypothetical protein